VAAPGLTGASLAPCPPAKQQPCQLMRLASGQNDAPYELMAEMTLSGAVAKRGGRLPLSIMAEFNYWVSAAFLMVC
jgi:hypothetical protein